MKKKKKSSLLVITWSEMRIRATRMSKDGTYGAIQLSFVVHPQIESAVHPSNAYQANSKAYEFQNTWRRITQLFCTDFDKDERILSKKLKHFNSTLTAACWHS